MKTIAASQFKAQCLKLMDEVQATRQPITITKHRRAVARLVPAGDGLDAFFGDLRSTTKIVGDIVAPAIPPEDWEQPQNEPWELLR